MTYDEKYNAKRDDEDSKKAFQYAKENWRPLYLIKMYDDEPSMIEMSFDLSHYQGQFEGMPAVGQDADISLEQAPPTEREGVGAQGPQEMLAEKVSKDQLPKDRHVYQTIYLDRGRSEKWTKDEVREDKVILEKWWKQQSHRWQHYGGTVPWMWTINGKNHTR